MIAESPPKLRAAGLEDEQIIEILGLSAEEIEFSFLRATHTVLQDLSTRDNESSDLERRRPSEASRRRASP